MDAYRDQYAKLFPADRKAVLLAISADKPGELASWAKDRGYPFTFLSDPGGAVGKAYGAFNATFGLDNRTLFIVDPDGKIGYLQAPFREIDPTAYTELAEALTRISK
jgi:peroxiredoxin